MEKTNWADRVKQRIKERRNERLHKIKLRKDNWIGRILHIHVTERKMDGMRKRGRRRKQLLDVLKAKRRYWNFREEALEHTVWWKRLLTCRKTEKKKNEDCKLSGEFNFIPQTPLHIKFRSYSLITTDVI